MDVPTWLAAARADADARGLPALKPLLEALARSTQALRDADAQFQHPIPDRTDDDKADDQDAG